MKQRITILFLILSVLCGLTNWQAFTSNAASRRPGAGQQAGEPFRVPAIAAGEFHNLALKSDGTVAAWGSNGSGETTIPATLSGVTAIAASFYHNLELKSDGTVVARGFNHFGETVIPANLNGVIAIATGTDHSLALRVGNNTAPTISNTVLTRLAGSPGSPSEIALVNDAESGAGGLAVTVTSANPANGVSVSNIVNSNSTITADVIAACGATSVTFTLAATDDGGATNTATLAVTVNPNTPPVLSYNAQTVALGTVPSLNPASGLSDNGTINPLTLQSISPSSGLTLSLNPASGQLVIISATLPNNYTVTVSATDNCGATTTAPFTVTVACPPACPTAPSASFIAIRPELHPPTTTAMR